MAEAAAKSGQPESMEDILQSIKRIIEDDSGPENAAEPVSGSADVLELTQAVKDDGSIIPIPALPKASTPSRPNEDIVKSIDAVFAQDAAVPPEEESHGIAQESHNDEPHTYKPFAMEEGLVSDEAANAALAALRPIVSSGARDYSIPRIDSAQLRNGNTVEDLVLEALRPMLKSWLDEHLPTIVHKIVEKEVKRIVTFHHE